MPPAPHRRRCGRLLPPDRQVGARHLDIHVVLDNLSAHTALEVTDWLGQPKQARWHLHFTPTSSSWLNVVERWFAELTGVVSAAVRSPASPNSLKPSPFGPPTGTKITTPAAVTTPVTEEAVTTVQPFEQFDKHVGEMPDWFRDDDAAPSDLVDVIAKVLDAGYLGSMTVDWNNSGLGLSLCVVESPCKGDAALSIRGQ